MGFQTLHTVLHRQCAEEVDQPICRQEMGVNHCPLDVVQVCVVLQGSLKKSRLFTETGDVSSVIMREHLIAHDGISDLRSSHEVHLQEPRLKRPLTGSVVFKSIPM